MQLSDAIFGRRTIHAFTNAPVDPSALDAAFAAAHMAPCHKTTWPWRFLVLGPQTRAALVPIAIAEKERKAPVSDAQRAGITRSLTAPGAVVAVSCDLHPKPETSRENYAAVACAIQNLMLTLHAHGYGTKWTTGGVTRPPETYALLGIDPAQAEIAGFVIVGVPAEVPNIPRPPVTDHVRHLP